MGKLMLFPTVILLFLLTVFPLLYSLALSLHSWDATDRLEGWEFRGLGNYRDAFTDPSVISSFRVTAIFIGGTVLAEIVLGLLIALLLYRQTWGHGLTRTIIMLPMMTTPVVVGLIWRLMYNTDIGWMNYGLSLIGLPGIDWLGSANTARLSVGIAEVWEWTPFVVLVLLAARQSLPVEPFEAAKVDGAKRSQTFYYLTLPFLLPAIVVCVLLRVIDSFKYFDLFYVLTGGGPGNSTEVISLHTYKQGFNFFNMGYAAALSYLMLFAVVIFANVVILSSNWRRER